MHAATLSGFHGQIHAFEPVPETYSDLASLVRQAGLEDRIRCHEAALSERTGTATMVLPDPAQSGWAQLTEDSAGFQVNLLRFDDLDIAPPKVIKIDAEGHELQVMKGAEATLRRHKPFVVFESWLDPRNPAAAAGPWRYLAELGYVFFCPAWHRDRDLISVSNMPPEDRSEFRLRLVSCTLEHTGCLASNIGVTWPVIRIATRNLPVSFRMKRGIHKANRMTRFCSHGSQQKGRVVAFLE